LIGTTFLRDRPDGDGLGLSVWNIPPRRLEQFAIAALVPGVMIFVAGRIAPRYRFTTAVVAAALFAVGYASLLSYSFGAGSIRPVSPFLDIWLPLVLNAVGIGIGLRNARELPEPASPTPSFRMPL
jgi:hypothetical protein